MPPEAKIYLEKTAFMQEGAGLKNRYATQN
jgi:hypothetical protein